MPSSFRVGFLGNSHTQTDSHELQIHILGRVHGHCRLQVDHAGLDLSVIIQEFGGLVSPEGEQLVIIFRLEQYFLLRDFLECATECDNDSFERLRVGSRAGRASPASLLSI